MKRIIAAVCASFIIAASFTSCYDPAKDPKMKLENGTTAAATEAESEAATEPPKPADYKDNLNGLRDYLKDLGYITIDKDNANVSKMNAKLIGAQKGNKYVMGDVSIEIYEYKLDGENKTRDEMLDSVKSKGSFTLYEKEVKATLSDNGKYLMIYSNSKIDENDKNSDAYKLREATIKAFKGFYK
ncbi:MAG: hypothetical protein VZR54_04680 [Ruminococcus sp.]|jgi:hypothetical protein|nr:hypothetical protein [Ruminococcus sp.]